MCCRLAVLVLSCAFASGCASRADFPDLTPARAPVGRGDPQTEARALAAEIVGKRVLVGELDKDIGEQLASARTAYDLAVYEARKGALDARIERDLLLAEASKRGLGVEALVKSEIDDRVAPPSEAEAQAFYEQYKDQMNGAPYEAMSEKIRAHIFEEKRTDRRRDLLDGLRKDHGVKVMLDPPRTEVEAKGPTRGDADAKVTIVIFSDFECPFCARAEPTMGKIRETWPHDVKFVFRHYPLPFHASARPAAAAASCAAEQGRFWEVHDRLFATRELGTDAIRAFLAGQSGFDLGRYDVCLSSGRGEAVVAADMAAAARAQVDSTPHFFVNGVRVSGAQPFEAFSGLIESELAR